jgi:hypothetical protein
MINTNETNRSLTLADRVKSLESKKKLEERTEDTNKKQKLFKYPFKWMKAFNQSKKKQNNEKMLVFFLNKKNEIELPKMMPIYEGNMIIWKNKPYEFDPRAIWNVRGVKGNPRAYVIKELDRRPVKNKYNKFVYTDAAVSNLDIDEIRARGDSTESDEFLIKAALKAQVSQENKKKMSMAVIVVVIVLVVGVAWFFLSKQPVA